MTTFSHTITLNDTERIALEDAINVYESFCNEKLSGEIRAPYWARREAINEIRRKLRDCNPIMTSTSSFGFDKY